MLSVALTFGFACTGNPDPNAGDTAACASETTQLPESCACDAPNVLVGGGNTAFAAVDDGDEATLVHGPQGGWHILGSVWLENLERLVTIHFTVTVIENATVVSDNLYRVQSVQVDPCTGYYPGMYGYLDVAAMAQGDADTPPELLAGKELLIRMDVVDLEGRTAADELRVLAVRDPADE